MTDNEQEFLNTIKKTYRQKSGYKIMLGCYSVSSKFIASIYKDVEIKTKWGVDVAEVCVSNICETNKEEFIKNLEIYMERREIEA